jgi:hypothetical protein
VQGNPETERIELLWGMGCLLQRGTQVQRSVLLWSVREWRLAYASAAGGTMAAYGCVGARRAGEVKEPAARSVCCLRVLLTSPLPPCEGGARPSLPWHLPGAPPGCMILFTASGPGADRAYSGHADKTVPPQPFRRTARRFPLLRWGRLGAPPEPACDGVAAAPSVRPVPQLG